MRLSLFLIFWGIVVFLCYSFFTDWRMGHPLKAEEVKQPLNSYIKTAEDGRSGYEEPSKTDDNSQNEKIHFYVAVDCSGSVDSNDILNFYIDATKLFSPFPKTDMFVFGGQIQRVEPDVWQNPGMSNIRELKRKIDPSKSNIAGALKTILEEIDVNVNKGNEQGIVLLVTDDLDFPKTRSTDTQNLRNQIQGIKQPISYYLVKIGPNENTYIKTEFPEFRTIPSSDHRKISQKIANQLNQILLENDLKVNISGQTPTNECSNCLTDSIFFRRDGVVRNQNIYFTYKPNPENKTLLLTPNPDETVYLPFTLSNKTHFLPVTVEVDSIIPCASNPSIRVRIVNDAQGNRANYFIESNTDKEVVIPCHIEYISVGLWDQITKFFPVFGRQKLSLAAIKGKIIFHHDAHRQLDSLQTNRALQIQRQDDNFLIHMQQALDLNQPIEVGYSWGWLQFVISLLFLYILFQLIARLVINSTLSGWFVSSNTQSESPQIQPPRTDKFSGSQPLKGTKVVLPAQPIVGAAANQIECYAGKIGFSLFNPFIPDQLEILARASISLYRPQGNELRTPSIIRPGESITLRNGQVCYLKVGNRLFYHIYTKR